MHAGKKIQRFYSRALKICSCYVLGSVRLECFIEIKKLLCIQNILALEDNKPIKIVFEKERLCFLEMLMNAWTICQK